MSNHFNSRLNDLLDLEHEVETVKEKQTTKQPDKKNESFQGNTEKVGIVNYEVVEVVPTEINDEQNKSDKELARASIRNVLNVANKNLGTLVTLAQATEHPRAFEAAATFAKTIMEAAKQLDEMVDGKQQTKKGASFEAPFGNNFNQQNNIYMSGEEAMKMIKDKLIPKPPQ